MLSVEPHGRERPVPASKAELDEQDLVRRAQLGSAAAFEELVILRGPQLFRYLAVRLGSESDARDALQETLTAAWQGLPALRDRGKFWSWLVGIATHKAADTRRGRMDTTDRVESHGCEDTSVLDLHQALAALPEHFRQVLLLRYLVQLSEDEVALALGIRVGTVKSRSARARRALEELLR
jgi:RNA polymerase sigma factor (sigma-70 family)